MRGAPEGWRSFKVAEQTSFFWIFHGIQSLQEKQETSIQF